MSTDDVVGDTAERVEEGVDEGVLEIEEESLAEAEVIAEVGVVSEVGLPSLAAIEEDGMSEADEVALTSEALAEVVCEGSLVALLADVSSISDAEKVVQNQMTKFIQTLMRIHYVDIPVEDTAENGAVDVAAKLSLVETNTDELDVKSWLMLLIAVASADDATQRDLATLLPTRSEQNSILTTGAGRTRDGGRRGQSGRP